MRYISRRPRVAFTLVQLLIVLALLAFLLGLLLPATARMRMAAARSQSMNNLKQLGLALHSCHDAYKLMPPIVGAFPQEKAAAYGTLHFYLLPFVEQNNVYQNAQGYVWKNNTWSELIPVFTSPSDPSVPPNYRHQGWLATTNYAANWMIFKKTGASLLNIPDGTSNTLFFAERYQVCNDTPCGWGYSSLDTWTPMFGYYSYGKFQHQPTQQECNPALAQSLDPGGIVVCMADGSVRTVSNTISPRTWWLVTDPADGEVLPNDWLQ
jgi:type II secretory pathway pseudopilin PulG